MGDGNQSAEWRQRYDHLWAARAEIARNLIAAGETDPLRIIQFIEQMDRRYVLMGDGTTTRWTKRAADPKSLLPSGIPAFRKAAFNGQRLELSAYTYANLPLFLADFISEQGPFDAVIELGCGYGQNLFKLGGSYLPRDLRYFGGELSASGVALARDLARLDSRLRAEFFQFDHLAADLSTVTGVANPLVFTCHSLEQVASVPQSLFAAIAGLAPRVTCVHLEPFGFQIRSMSPSSQDQRRHFEREGWNLDLHTAAERAEKAGIIKRTALIPEIFVSSDELNVTSLMVWTNQKA